MHDDSTSNNSQSIGSTPQDIISDAHLRMLREESGIAKQSIAIPLTFEDWREHYA